MGCSSTKTILLLCPEDFNLTHHFNSFYRFGSNANSFIFWLIAWLLDWFCTPSVTQATSSIMIDFFISNNIIVTITPWIARIILRFLPCWRTMPLNTYIVVWIIKTSFWNYSANEITRCFAGNYLRWHHIGAKKRKCTYVTWLETNRVLPCPAFAATSQRSGWLRVLSVRPNFGCGALGPF